MNSEMRLSESAVSTRMMNTTRDTNNVTFAGLSNTQRLQQINQWKNAQRSSQFKGRCEFVEISDCTTTNTQDVSTLVCENQDWTVHAIVTDETAFATRLTAKRCATQLNSLSESETVSLASILAKLSTRYDNLMMADVALDLEWQQMTDHASVCSALIIPRGSESDGVFGVQRFIGSDFTAEQSARRLRNLSDIHFRDLFPE